MSCKKTAALLFAATLAMGLLAGCESSNPGTTPENEAPPTVDGLNTEGMFTNRDMEGNDTDTGKSGTESEDPTLGGSSASAAASLPPKTTITATGDGVTVTGNTVTVTKGGTVTLKGDLANGQILINAGSADKVQLYLDGVNAYNSTSAVLYVAQADKVFLTLKAGTQNSLRSTGTFPTSADSNVDGAVFSKDDLTINGGGALTVSSTGHGIVCKDSLVITGGTHVIDAQGHAIQSKDDVRIAAGTFRFTAGKDGIHVENSEDATLGFLYIEGGSYTIDAGGDGFSASGVLQVAGGTGTLTAGGGAPATVSSGQGGYGHPYYGNNASTATDEDVSTKGMKASGNLLLGGGTWGIDAADDGIHTNASATITKGAVTVATGDDGIHADSALVISGGELTVSKSYEGLEGTTIEITGGTIHLTASDDGINAAGGNDESGYGGRTPDNFNTGNSNSYIRISGGKLSIDAGGDGIDSNGGLYVTGGETYVAGPTNSGNGALDYATAAQVTGGTLVATGAGGMATGFTEAQNQGAMLVNVSSFGSGAVTFKDSGGNTLLSFAPGKSYSSVVLTCPGIKQGETYILTIAGQTVTVTMDELLYSSGGMSGPGGMGGPGAGMGGRPGKHW